MALTSTRTNDGLQALHRILIQTRFLAGTGADARKVVGLMDDAEYLVTLMAQPETKDERFRLCLEGMEQKHPELAGLTAAFGARAEEQKAA